MDGDNHAGRPLKFKSVEDLQQKIESYFKKMDSEGRPYTITGLALWLDTTRRTLLDYEEKDGYSHTIKIAKLKCENYAEEALFTSKNTAGVIFNMKNNYNWADKQEVVNINKNSIENLTEEEIEAQIKELENKK